MHFPEACHTKQSRSEGICVWAGKPPVEATIGVGSKNTESMLPGFALTAAEAKCAMLNSEAPPGHESSMRPGGIVSGRCPGSPVAEKRLARLRETARGCANPRKRSMQQYCTTYTTDQIVPAPIEMLPLSEGVNTAHVKARKREPGKRDRPTRTAAPATAVVHPEMPEAQSPAPPAQEPGSTRAADAPPRTPWKKPFPLHAICLLKDNAFRPPDWRWRLANHLAETGRPPGSYPLDGRVYAVVRYLRRGRPLRDWPTPSPTGTDWRPLQAALALYQTQSDRRTELEAPWSWRNCSGTSPPGRRHCRDASNLSVTVSSRPCGAG